MAFLTTDAVQDRPADGVLTSAGKDAQGRSHRTAPGRLCFQFQTRGGCEGVPLYTLKECNE